MRSAFGLYGGLICVIMIVGAVLWLSFDSENPSSVLSKAKSVDVAAHTQSSADDDALVESIENRPLPRITFSPVTLAEHGIYDLGDVSAMGVHARDADGHACPVQVARIQYKDFSKTEDPRDWETLYYGQKVENDSHRQEIHLVDPGRLAARRGAYRVTYRAYETFRGTVKEAFFTTVFPVDV